MKWLRRLFLGLEGVVLLVVAAAAFGAWWLVATEQGFAWLMARIPASSGLRIESPGGSLIREWQFARLVYEGEDLRLEAERVRATGNVFALLLGRVSLSELRVERFSVELGGEDKPPSPPKRLALPIGLRIAHAEIAQFDFANRTQHLHFSDLKLEYEGGPSGHRVRSLTAATPWGEAALQGEIAAAPPFTLSGAASLLMPGGEPLAAGVELGGELEHIRAEAAASVRGVAIRGRAEIAPFQELRVQSMEAHVDPVDIARFAAGLPHTALELHLTAREHARDRLSGSIGIANHMAGALDRERLPLASAASRFEASLDRLRLEELSVDTGGGTLFGRAEATRAGGDLVVQGKGIDLHAFAAKARNTALQGPLRFAWSSEGQSLQAKLEQSDMSVALDALRRGDAIELKSFEAQANGGKASGSGRIELARAMPFQANLVFSGLDPSRFGDYPAGMLNGTARAKGEAREPRRVDGEWNIERSQLLGRPFTSKGSASVQGERVAQVEALVRYGSSDGTARGSFGRAADELRIVLNIPKLAELVGTVSGSARGDGRLTGSWSNPVLSMRARAEQLRGPQGMSAAALEANAALGRSLAAPFEFRILARKVGVRGLELEQVLLQSAGTVSAHEASIATRATGIEFDAVLRGGWDEARGWSGQIVSMRNRGVYPLALTSPARLEASPTHAHLGRLEASLGDGRLLVRELDWQSGRLASNGEFRGLPAQWIVWATDMAQRVESTMLLDGSWSLATRDYLEGTVSLRRSGGDLRLPGSTPIVVGLQRLAVEGRFVKGQLTASVDASSKIGSVSGEASISPVAGASGLGFEADSPLAFRVDFNLAEVEPIANLFITQARVGGRVSASLGGGGTLAEPKVTGTVSLDAMSVAMPSYGVYLSGGRLRALLERDAVLISELSMQSGDGELTGAGSVPLHANQGGLDLAWQARNFRVLERPDMRLVVSGDGAVRLGEKVHTGKLVLSGQLRANQGRFDLGQDSLPKLGDDVVVLGRTRANGSSMKVPIALDLSFDLGDQLAVKGYGFEGRIGGQLRLSSDESGEPLAYGKLVAVNSTFEAYGQRLQVDPGALVFDGPIRNPALQVTAWRRNQAVEAGVQLTGTVRNPQVQLVSNPAVPDGEKLSWLVLGRAPSEANRADLGLLQTAASAMFARGNSVPATTRLARAFGFDELAFRGGSDLSGRVVALGKRLSDRLYVTYEQGLGTVATNLVKLDYILTQRFSVRAEAGTASGLGLFYRFSWD